MEIIYLRLYYFDFSARLSSFGTKKQSLFWQKIYFMMWHVFPCQTSLSLIVTSRFVSPYQNGKHFVDQLIQKF